MLLLRHDVRFNERFLYDNNFFFLIRTRKSISIFIGAITTLLIVQNFSGVGVRGCWGGVNEKKISINVQFVLQTNGRD
jgi:hypothetical protein